MQIQIVSFRHFQVESDSTIQVATTLTVIPAVCGGHLSRHKKGQTQNNYQKSQPWNEELNCFNSCLTPFTLLREDSISPEAAFSQLTPVPCHDHLLFPGLLHDPTNYNPLNGTHPTNDECRQQIIKQPPRLKQCRPINGHQDQCHPMAKTIPARE